MNAVHPNRCLEHNLVPRRAREESSVPLRRYGLYLSVFALVYVLLFISAVPTFIDEAYTYNLASDSSLGHMFRALRDGADGSLPLYALLVYGWGKVFGTSELSLRLNSAVFVLLFVWYSCKRLGELFGPPIATLAVLFVLSDKIFAYYALQARFYGLLIFLFCACFWSSWDLVQTRGASLRCLFRHAVICGLLCLSHPLGLAYTAILTALYVAFSLALGSFSLTSASTFLGGPGLFLLWLPSFLSQRLVNPTYASGRPGWPKYWQFAFFDSGVLFLTVLAGLAVVVGSRLAFKWGNNETSEGIGHAPDQDQFRHQDNYLLVFYCVVFIVCINGVLALLDGLHIIPVYWMAAVRYLLVCWVPYAVIIAAIFDRTARLIQKISEHHRVQASGRVQFLLVLLGLGLLMASHSGEWFRGKASDTAFFSKISRIANERHLDVVCKSHWDAFYLATRTPTPNVAYLLEDNFPFKRFLLQTSKYYPKPVPICPPAKLNYTKDYIFLTDSPKEAKIVNPTSQ